MARGGPTDSFGPTLRLQTNGLAFLPYGNGVHYDSEATRRPMVHGAVADGALPLTFCTDDGTGLLYQGTTMTAAVSELDSANCYRVAKDGDTVVEDVLDTRRL